MVSTTGAVIGLCVAVDLIIFVKCNWVITRWQWLFYMYTNMVGKKVTRKLLHSKPKAAVLKTGAQADGP